MLLLMNLWSRIGSVSLVLCLKKMTGWVMGSNWFFFLSLYYLRITVPIDWIRRFMCWMFLRCSSNRSLLCLVMWKLWDVLLIDKLALNFGTH